jgi:tRNA nucleotidyltransferase (CCA-adding enzyme)
MIDTTQPFQYPLPREITWAIREMRTIGGRPLLVGGCIRDAILGLPSKDIDIEVHGDVDIEELAEVLSAVGTVTEAGRSFGVLKVRAGGVDLDVSLPRRDSKTGSGHRGFSITTDASLTLAEASARRDFTINSIMLDPVTGEVIDCHGGLADLEAGIIRHTSDAFADDPLRVLRGVQFAARFGFTMAPETVELCQSLLGTAEARSLSLERIWGEWEKIGTRGVHINAALDVLGQTCWVNGYPALANMSCVIQDQKWHPEGDVLTHAGLAANQAARLADLGGITGEDRLVLVFAALLHDVGKYTCTKLEDDGRVTAHGHDKAGVIPAQDFLFSIGCPHHIVNRITPLIREHMNVLTKPTPTTVRRMARRLQPATMAEMALVSTADVNGRGLPDEVSPADQWLEMSRSLKVSEKPVKGILTGDHLINAGMKPGPEFKVILADAVVAQDDGEFTDVTGALAWLRERGIVKG